MHKIGAAIERYQTDHTNRLPNTLFVLIPDYINQNEAYILLPPEKYSFWKQDTSPETLQKNCAYTYLGERGLSVGIIFHERMDLWKNESHLSDKVFVWETNQSVVWLQTNELSKRLEQLK